MPKTKQVESALHDWVHGLTFQMQALLMTGMRGPDENNKYNAAKAITRYLRGAICKPAGNWTFDNNNDFMWGEYNLFEGFAKAFWADHDEYPHHFIMHLIHCAEVIGYFHPDEVKRANWFKFYRDACNSFHMMPASMEQLSFRLNDFGASFFNKIITK